MKDKILEIMRKNHLSFDKKLGQNFLVDDFVLFEILSQASIQPHETVLEIGPGLGVLTEELAVDAKKVIAVELDKKLAAYLRKNMPENVEVVNQDFLEMELPKVDRVIANIPYYITKPIVTRLLENKIPSIILMQKEVAQRVCATGGGDFGAFSVFCQYYSQPEIIVNVPRECFVPSPKVNSAVVRFDILDNPPVKADKDKFFSTVQAAFSQKRKTLGNALPFGLKLSKEDTLNILSKAEISPNLRAEQLSLLDFERLTNALD